MLAVATSSLSNTAAYSNLIAQRNDILFLKYAPTLICTANPLDCQCTYLRVSAHDAIAMV